ncbi:hypothetical protein FB451DRAFT_1265033 [Mycena latifolia]|nr:hypothetical protein FB451DRAFT_1265033 [Mycena latifolia]
MQQACLKCGAPPEFETMTLRPQAPLASPADFTRLLTSNDVPLDNEVPQIRQIVADSQDRADALDAQIDGLRAALAQLVQQRHDLVRDMREYKAILSPIRRVPAELICAIFSMVLPFTRCLGGSSRARSSDYARPNERIQIIQSPWGLGHICRFWRAAALSYPPLW